MTGTSAVELYYDPYDFAIDDDPYPIWKRLRDEAPLYYNEKYNFYALSRYEDVARELHELGDLPLRARHHDGHHPERHPSCRPASSCSRTHRFTICIADCSQGFSRHGGWRRSSR